jgi:hypothetical protein
MMLDYLKLNYNDVIRTVWHEITKKTAQKYCLRRKQRAKDVLEKETQMCWKVVVKNTVEMQCDYEANVGLLPSRVCLQVLAL